jgi:hypothetical protein
VGDEGCRDKKPSCAGGRLGGGGLFCCSLGLTHNRLGEMLMGNLYGGAICVVAASKHGKTEYWVAATSPEQATGAVQLVLGPTWNVKLLNRRLAPTQLAELNLGLVVL